MYINISVSLKDILWRLDNPDVVSDTIDSLTMMWIDEYIKLWKDFLHSDTQTVKEFLEEPK